MCPTLYTGVTSHQLQLSRCGAQLAHKLCRECSTTKDFGLQSDHRTLQQPQNRAEKLLPLLAWLWFATKSPNEVVDWSPKATCASMCAVLCQSSACIPRVIQLLPGSLPFCSSACLMPHRHSHHSHPQPQTHLHLCGAALQAGDKHIVESVARMQRVIELSRIVRERHGKPLKMPLRSLTVVAPDAGFLADLGGELRHYVLEEVRVAALLFMASLSPSKGA